MTDVSRSVFTQNNNEDTLRMTDLTSLNVPAAAKIVIVLPDGENVPLRTAVFGMRPDSQVYELMLSTASPTVFVQPEQDFDKAPMAAVAEEVSSPESPRRYFIIGTSWRDCHRFATSDSIMGFNHKHAELEYVWDVDQFEDMIRVLTPEDKRQVSSHWTKSAQDMNRELSKHDPMVNWYNTMIRLSRDAAGMDPIPDEQLSDTVAPAAGMAPKTLYVGVVAQTYEDANRYLAGEPQGFKNDPNVKITILLSPRKVQVFLSETYGKDRQIAWTHQARLLLKRNHEDYVVMSDLLGNKGMGYEVTRIPKGYLVIGETLQDAASYANSREDISGRDGMGGEFFRLITSPASMTSFINAREYDKVDEFEVIWTQKAKAKYDTNIPWGAGINGRILELHKSQPRVDIKWVNADGVLTDDEMLEAQEDPNIHIVVGLSQREVTEHLRDSFKPHSSPRLRPGYRIEQVWTATQLMALIKELGQTPVHIHWAGSMRVDDISGYADSFYDYVREIKKLTKKFNAA